MNADCHAVREITFEHDGRKIKPEEVFQRLYQGLTRLLLPVRQTSRQQRMTAFAPALLHERDARYMLWRAQQQDITATLVFDTTEKRECIVSARTNFDLSSLRKFPNIVYVHDRSGQVYILRESRKYPLDEFINKVMRQRFPNRYDAQKTAQFYESEISESSHVDCASPKKIMHIPEPQLLIGLEQVYQAYNTVRLTPSFSVVDHSQEKLWSLRRFYPTLRDLSFNQQGLLDYMALLHALGLIELVDRQVVHYCLEKEAIVNFDPDFACHTLSGGILHYADMKDFFHTFNAADEYTHFYNDRNKRREWSREVRKRSKTLQERGIHRETLFDYLQSAIIVEGLKKIELNVDGAQDD